MIQFLVSGVLYIFCDVMAKITKAQHCEQIENYIDRLDQLRELLDVQLGDLTLIYRDLVNYTEFKLRSVIYRHFILKVQTL